MSGLKKQKNHLLLFKSAKIILEKGFNVHFLFVGDTLFGGLRGTNAYKNLINNQIDELGIRDNCIFLGNRDDLASIYSSCDVTVLPSLYEGTPNVVLESMACGTPVIATDVSDNAIIIKHNVTGYVIPLEADNELAEKLFFLFENKLARDKMGIEARNWVVNEFSPEALARKSEQVYTELLHERTAHSH